MFFFTPNILVLVFSSIAILGNAFESEVFKTENAKNKEHVRGTIVEISGFPYQVSIKKGRSFLCSGAIISDRHILTSAACFKQHITNPSDTPYHVTTGTACNFEFENSWSVGETHNVKNVTIHPKFSTSEIGNRTLISNNIAVITLFKPIQFNSFQKPVSLPKKKTDPDTNTILSGWGTLKIGRQPNTKLRAVRRRILSEEQCKYMKSYLKPEQICANNHGFGAGTCIGDNGSPLVSDNVVIGIASFLTDECGTGSPDIFIDVYQHVPYINEIIEQDRARTKTSEYGAPSEPNNCSPTAKSYLQKAFVPSWENEDFLDKVSHDYSLSKKHFKESLHWSNIYIENRHLPIMPSC